MKGKVKFYNELKGFGFITADDGKEYFVHLTGLNSGVTIKEHDAVTFDVEQGDRGPKAVNVGMDDGEEQPAEDSADEEESAPAADDAEDDAEEEKPQDA